MRAPQRRSGLAAELAESLDANGDGFGAQLFSYAGTETITSLLGFALDAVGDGLQIAHAGIEGALFYGLDAAGSVSQGLPLAPPNPAIFLGSYIGRQVVTADNDNRSAPRRLAA